MGSSRISRWRWLSLALLAAGVGSLALYIGCFRKTAAPAEPKAAAGNIYAADAPLAQMPEKLLPDFILLSPQQVLQIPVADGFMSPIGTAGGALVYDAQPFGTPNERRGGNHVGADLNGIGGENTDLGDTVYAAGRGLVVFSGDAGPGWGQVVVLAHRLPGDRRVIQTLYAHLENNLVHTGQLIARGEPIGSIGTANGAYPAHLHFEVIASRATESGQAGYAKDGVMNRLDPSELLQHYPAPPVPDPYDAVRRLRLREAALQDDAAPAPPLPEGSIPVKPTQFL